MTHLRLKKLKSALFCHLWRAFKAKNEFFLLTLHKGFYLDMSKQRILFVSPEIAPYLPASENSRLGRELPTEMQARKFEVRTFMPNFGAVNERRNQLHEVIRLSGINIPIRDTDHPLIIKVASMQPSRIQVYFIDNDDYFQKLDSDVDAYGSNRPDNDERVIFFARGTVDTARKLKWEPDFMNVSGWISALVPLYVKKIFVDDNSFANTKVIYTVLDEPQAESIAPDFLENLKADGVKPSDLKNFKDMPVETKLLHKIAMKYSDAIAFHTSEPDAELLEYARSLNVPVTIIDKEGDVIEQYHNIYKSLAK